MLLCFSCTTAGTNISVDFVIFFAYYWILVWIVHPDSTCFFSCDLVWWIWSKDLVAAKIRMLGRFMEQQT